MVTLYLVRHAHADWAPDEDRPLSARGEADARRVADLLEPFPIEAVYASPARRARDTVAPLAERRGLTVELVESLAERRLAAGAVEDFDAAVRWTWEHPDEALPGGESNRAAQTRGWTALQAIMARHANGHVVVASHGNLLALVLQCVDPSVDHAFWRRMTMPDVYRLQGDADCGWRVERLWREAGAAPSAT
ncbi:MAG: histidine phosphatase family protein [Clostridia bacterium]|nr:histidine phosphatase family protein [Clostridia bacterium]